MRGKGRGRKSGRGEKRLERNRLGGEGEGDGEKREGIRRRGERSSIHLHKGEKREEMT